MSTRVQTAPLRTLPATHLIPGMQPAATEPPPSSGSLPERVPAIGELVAVLADRDDQTIRHQVELASIAAPTGGEGRRAAWMADALRTHGVPDVRIDSVGNVIARIAGQEPLAPIVVLAHLDTVFPESTAIDLRRDGSRLFGPGINDNARGLAASLTIAAELATGRYTFRRPIVLVATVGEEGAGDLRGAKHYFARSPEAAAAIALDGAGDDRIVHQALGSRRFRVTFDGPGGHSWSAFGAPNAVHAAGACASRLGRLRLPRSPRASLTVARIGGGLAVNAIPDHAWLEVDTRSADRQMLDWLEREVHRATREAVREENERRTRESAVLSAAVRCFGDRPPGATPADHPLVQAALAATHAIGRRPELALASTDANVPMALGIPAIAIGAGGIGGDAHTEQEWFENVEGPRGIARALAILLAVANG